MTGTRFVVGVAAVLFAAVPAGAQNANFHGGPVFMDFGKVAAVDADVPIPPGTVFKVAFDAHEPGKPDALNRTLGSAARFVNMHVAAGVPLDRIHVAVVLHGPTIFDVATDAAYGRQYPGKRNPNAVAVRALLDRGVRIIVCGQSIAALDVAKPELLPGVRLSLSAMTAHALLQQQGYTLNPF